MMLSLLALLIHITTAIFDDDDDDDESELFVRNTQIYGKEIEEQKNTPINKSLVFVVLTRRCMNENTKKRHSDSKRKKKK